MYRHNLKITYCGNELKLVCFKNWLSGLAYAIEAEHTEAEFNHPRDNFFLLIA